MEIQTQCNRCYYCDESILWADEMYGANSSRRKYNKSKTREHIVPLSWGGIDHPINLIFVCKDCNESRGNIPLEEFKIRVTSPFTHERIDILIAYVNNNRQELTKVAATSKFRGTKFFVDDKVEWSAQVKQRPGLR